MKIFLKSFPKNPALLLRSLGYHPDRFQKKGVLSFSRRMGIGNYPKFHFYLEKGSKGLLLNLHLDQKQPSYKGSYAHSGEYEGEAIKQEMDKIKKLFDSTNL